MNHWTFWSDEAEKIHGITRPELEFDGIVAKDFVHTLNKMLDDETVYYDSIQWDGFWCNVLFSDNGIHRKFKLLDIQDLIAVSDNQLATFLAERSNLEASNLLSLHRALDDAQVILSALDEVALKSSNS